MITNKGIKIAVAGTGLCRDEYRHVAGTASPSDSRGCHSRKSGEDKPPVLPIQDEYIEKYLAEKPLNLATTLDVFLKRSAMPSLPIAITPAWMMYICISGLHMIIRKQHSKFNNK